MKTMSLACGCWLVLSAWGADAAELPGIYVRRNEPSQRIEFLADGTFWRDCCSGGPGTFAIEQDVIVCSDGDRKTQFRRQERELIDEEGHPWVPRAELAKLPWSELAPVRFTVVDNATTEPITEFSYTYTISTPQAKYDPLLVRPIEVKSQDGVFTLSAPASCQISMGIEGPTLVGGFGNWHVYHLTTGTRERKFQIPVQSGVTVTGTVVDSATQEPIAGARVAPVVSRPPGSAPDTDRAVQTDARGRFTIKGVSAFLGVNVWHADYLESDPYGNETFDGKPGVREYKTRIALKSGETLIGVVNDAAGSALAGVTVSDGAGKTASTGADGTFVLRSPSKWGNDATYSLSFEKAGYLDEKLSPTSAVPGGLSVVLEPQPILQGLVRDPEGRPVTAFLAAAGPGLEPRGWVCSSQQVRDPEGQFQLAVRTDRDYDKTGKVWVGIQAPGFARWETTIDSWKGAHALTADLKRGVAVTGSVQNRERIAGTLSAQLLPARLHQERFTNEMSLRQELGKTETAVDDRGGFQFEHLAAGRYFLVISGPEFTPVSSDVRVADAPITLEPVSVVGRGSIFGIAFDPQEIRQDGVNRLDPKRSAWAFASGDVSFRDSTSPVYREEFPFFRSIPFQADEQGRFRVDGIPAGLVSVNFPFQVNDHIVDSHSRTAQVVEGKATEVRLGDNSGDWDVTCQFVVGDGSPAQLISGTGGNPRSPYRSLFPRVELIPQQTAPLSYAGRVGRFFGESGEHTETIADNVPRAVLHDIHPGRYRLVAGNPYGDDYYSATVDTKPGGPPIRIPLGAGSVTGRIQRPDGSVASVGASRRSHSVIRMFAVRPDAPRTQFGEYCATNGQFCIRFLPPGCYRLFAYDADAGWQRLPDALVHNNVHAAGGFKLIPGGAIAGKIPARWKDAEGLSLVATDLNGLSVSDSDYELRRDKHEYIFRNLWPGRWTVTLKEGEQVLANRTVDLRGVETIACELPEK